jgi:hypothetical protein
MILNNCLVNIYRKEVKKVGETYQAGNFEMIYENIPSHIQPRSEILQTNVFMKYPDANYLGVIDAYFKIKEMDEIEVISGDENLKNKRFIIMGILAYPDHSELALKEKNV